MGRLDAMLTLIDPCQINRALEASGNDAALAEVLEVVRNDEREHHGFLEAGGGPRLRRQQADHVRTAHTADAERDVHTSGHRDALEGLSGVALDDDEPRGAVRQRLDERQASVGMQHQARVDAPRRAIAPGAADPEQPAPDDGGTAGGLRLDHQQRTAEHVLRTSPMRSPVPTPGRICQFSRPVTSLIDVTVARRARLL
jgi:hypothetical protein